MSHQAIVLDVIQIGEDIYPWGVYRSGFPTLNPARDGGGCMKLMDAS